MNQTTSLPLPGDVLTVDQLLNLPPAEWIIDRMITKGCFAMLYGPGGAGKSFVAVDWALSIATGRSWCGHAVKPGKVMYVAGEGTVGVSKRVQAWMKHNNVTTLDGAFFKLNAPQMINHDSLNAFTEVVMHDAIQPSFIVLDTLARCFVGGDENLQKDAGQFVDACRYLQVTTGATVLVIHHTGKPRDDGRRQDERGSSSFRNGTDVMFAQQMRGATITLTNDRQKDDEEHEPITVQLKQIDLGAHPVTGNPINSCVIVDGTEPSIVKDIRDMMEANPDLPVREVARVLAATSGRSEDSIRGLIRRHQR